jgi:hypothetical protein
MKKRVHINSEKKEKKGGLHGVTMESSKLMKHRT